MKQPITIPGYRLVDYNRYLSNDAQKMLFIFNFDNIYIGIKITFKESYWTTPGIITTVIIEQFL